MAKVMPPTTRHDPAADGRLGGPFVQGQHHGDMKGSQSQYRRESYPVAVGSSRGQPALRGMVPHPIPPPKGDRW